jgi:hypothetical protein
MLIGRKAQPDIEIKVIHGTPFLLLSPVDPNLII